MLTGGCEGGFGLGAACFVQLRIDRPGRFRRHAGYAFELLLRGGKHLLGRAEVPQQCTAARRAYTLEGVEDRFPCSRRAALAVKTDPEAVRPVADLLQGPKPGPVRVEPNRIGRA